MFNNFNAQRKRSAKKLGNPRLLKIHFHTLRHWKATIYTQLVEFEGDEHCSAIASNVEEAKKLIEAGFEYICNHENVMLFRKRK
jgi:hypothetical protein